MPAGGMTDAAKAIRTGVDVRLQHVADRGAERKIGESHDTGGNTRCSISAARTHCSYALYEFRFADGTQSFGSGRSIHRPAFHEHGGNDVVTAVHIPEQLVQ